MLNYAQREFSISPLCYDYVQRVTLNELNTYVLKTFFGYNGILFSRGVCVSSSVTCITPANYQFLIAACVLLCRWVTTRCRGVHLLTRNAVMAFAYSRNCIHRYNLATVVNQATINT